MGQSTSVRPRQATCRQADSVEQYRYFYSYNAVFFMQHAQVLCILPVEANPSREARRSRLLLREENLGASDEIVEESSWIGWRQPVVGGQCHRGYREQGNAAPVRQCECPRPTIKSGDLQNRVERGRSRSAGEHPGRQEHCCHCVGPCCPGDYQECSRRVYS